MTRARRQPKPPRGDVPGKRSNDRAENRRHCDDVGVHQPLANCRSHCAAKKRAGEIEKCRHGDRLARRQNSCGNDRGDRISGVVKAVAVFKNDRRNDDGKEGQHSRSRLRVFQRDLKNDVSCVAAAVDHLLQ